MSDQITIEQKKETLVEVGQRYLFITVTLHLVGTVTEIKGSDCKIVDVALIGETGQLKDTLKTGKLQKYEVWPSPFAIINLDAKICVVPFPHKLS